MIAVVSLRVLEKKSDMGGKCTNDKTCGWTCTKCVALKLILSEN